MKSWLNSKTIWLMVSEAAGVWTLYAKEELSLLAAVILSIQAIAGIANRFYTNIPISKKAHGE